MLIYRRVCGGEDQLRGDKDSIFDMYVVGNGQAYREVITPTHKIDAVSPKSSMFKGAGNNRHAIAIHFWDPPKNFGTPHSQQPEHPLFGPLASC